MSAEERAENQLTRILNFFAKVESKATAMFAVSVGMLGLMVINVKPENLTNNYVWGSGGLTLLLLAIVIFLLYRVIFPDLKTGTSTSVLYFRNIADLEKLDFIKELKGVAEYETELLDQIWCNAKILKNKFENLEIAFIVSALSIVPWLFFLYTIAISNSGIATP